MNIVRVRPQPRGHCSEMATLPAGVFPTMITPFVADGSAIDWVVLDKLVDWYIASGVTGLFACCLSSEMYELSADERVELLVADDARRVGVGVALPLHLAQQIGDVLLCRR